MHAFLLIKALLNQTGRLGTLLVTKMIHALLIFMAYITDCYLQDSAMHYCLLLNRSLSYFYGLAKPKQCCCVGNVDLMVSKKKQTKLWSH